jgi:hypothetical protein
MEIDAAILDKFPKNQTGPCVFAADPLSLTALSAELQSIHAPVSLLPAHPA